MNRQRNKPTASAIQAGAFTLVGLLAFVGSTQGQTVSGSSHIDMGSQGNIRNAPHINLPSLSNSSQSPATWANQALSGFVIPAGQLTGLAMDGTNVAFLDLMPIRAQSLSVASSDDVTADVVQINQDGITSSAFNILDQSSTDSDGNPVSHELAVNNGQLQVNGYRVEAKSTTDIAWEDRIADMRQLDLPNGTSINVMRTEVTFARWMDNLVWSLLNGYSYDNEEEIWFHHPMHRSPMLIPDTSVSPARIKFADVIHPTTPGMSQGGLDHPVGGVSFLDVAAWCNALSQRAKLDPVYYTSESSREDADIFRGVGSPADPPADPSADPSADSPVTRVYGDDSKNGYRVATVEEATELLANASFDVHAANVVRDNYLPRTSQAVASYREDPAYTLYDIVGNVWEWAYKDESNSDGNNYTAISGGSGFRYMNAIIDEPLKDLDAQGRDASVGFRLIRSHFPAE